jgi:hypothetical protein
MVKTDEVNELHGRLRMLEDILSERDAQIAGLLELHRTVVSGGAASGIPGILEIDGSGGGGSAPLAGYTSPSQAGGDSAQAAAGAGAASNVNERGSGGGDGGDSGDSAAGGYGGAAAATDGGGGNGGGADSTPATSALGGALQASPASTGTPGSGSERPQSAPSVHSGAMRPFPSLDSGNEAAQADRDEQNDHMSAVAVASAATDASEKRSLLAAVDGGSTPRPPVASHFHESVADGSSSSGHNTDGGSEGTVGVRRYSAGAAAMPTARTNLHGRAPPPPPLRTPNV